MAVKGRIVSLEIGGILIPYMRDVADDGGVREVHIMKGCSVGYTTSVDFEHAPQSRRALYCHSAEQVWGSTVFGGLMIDKSGRLV